MTPCQTRESGGRQRRLKVGDALIVFVTGAIRIVTGTDPGEERPMRTFQERVSMFTVASATALLLSCSAAEQTSDSEAAQRAQSALSADDRLAACSQDPRVMAGLLSPDVCAGGDIFLRET